jgi:hypothetical protein
MAERLKKVEEMYAKFLQGSRREGPEILKGEPMHLVGSLRWELIHL